LLKNGLKIHMQGITVLLHFAYHQMSDTILLQNCMKNIRIQIFFKIIISNPRRINYKSGQVFAEPGLTGVLFNVISLTGRGDRDSLK